MRSTLRDMLLLVCAGLVLVILPVFLTRLSPIEVNFPVVNQDTLGPLEPPSQQVSAQSSKAAALKAKMRKIHSCENDEDCIIVDKDPCGCLVGPAGVTAINALYTLDFDKLQTHTFTETCPDAEPSTEQECSASAHAVCQANVCKIVY